VVVTRIAGHEVADDLIAHETLDERPALNERIDALAVEVIHHVVYPRCAKPLCHRGRAANIREEGSELDLSATLVLHQSADAHGAVPRILDEGRPPQETEHGSERAFER